MDRSIARDIGERGWNNEVLAENQSGQNEGQKKVLQFQPHDGVSFNRRFEPEVSWQ